MSSWKSTWWLVAAPLISSLTIAGGVGNLLSDDGGPTWGKWVYIAAASLGAGLVVGGLLLRRDQRRAGSVMIALGVVPGFPLVAFLWAPPVALIGVISMIVSTVAISDYVRRAPMSQPTT